MLLKRLNLLFTPSYYFVGCCPVLCVFALGASDALVVRATAGRGRERDTAAVSTPAEVTACCWDTNTPGRVGLCGADGSFVVANHDRGGYIQVVLLLYAHGVSFVRLICVIFFLAAHFHFRCRYCCMLLLHGRRTAVRA